MLDLENFPDVGINLDTMLFGKEKEPKIEDDITKTENFAAVAEKMYAVGRIGLRRSQFRLAEKSAAMAIFLGKNYLGQTDKDYWQRQQDEKAFELKEKQVEQKDW